MFVQSALSYSHLNMHRAAAMETAKSDDCDCVQTKHKQFRQSELPVAIVYHFEKLNNINDLNIRLFESSK